MTNNEINFILDIGNVIFEWNPHKHIATIFTDKKEREFAYEAIIQHSNWLDLNRGKLNLKDAIRNTIERCNLDPYKIEQAYLRTPHSLFLIEPMVEAVTKLSSHDAPLYILSNIPKYCWEYLSKTYDIWSHFRGVTLSYQEGVIKPEAEIFNLICSRYQLEPTNCVFFDDLEENIEAARKFGMKGEHISDSKIGYQALYRIAAGHGLYFETI